MSNTSTSIKDRVRAVILLASVIVMLATALAFVLSGVASFKDQLIRHLSTLAAMIANNSVAPLTFDDKAVAEDILSAVKEEPDIVAVALYDRDGNVFATYPRLLPSELLPARLEKSGYQVGEGGVGLFQPVIQEEKLIGTLYLRSSFQGLYRRFRRHGLIVAAVLTGSLGIAVVLSTLLQRRISSPILALTQAAQAIAQKEDYSVRVIKSTKDELGTLTDAFNRMLGQIQEHQGRLGEQARLLDLSSDAIMVRDAEGRIIYWNQGAEGIYGWPREEALGKMKAELLQTEFPEKPEQIYSRLRQEGRWAGDLIQTRRDGTRIHVSTRWVLDRQAQANLGSVLITDNDITARKQAEEKLRESREELRRTLEFDEAVMTNMGEGLYTMDSHGAVTSMNPAAEKLLGWTFAELRGRRMHEMTHYKHPDGTPYPAEECPVLKVLQQGKAVTGQDDVFIRKDGTYFDIVYSSSPIQSGETIVGLVVVFRDVSESKKAQEALRESEERFRALGDNIAQLAWMADPAGSIFWFNKRWFEYTGTNPQQEGGSTCEEVIHPDHREMVMTKWRSRVERGEVWEDTFPLRSKEGEYRWFLSHAFPIKDSQGRIVRWFGTNTDITEHKRFEAELERLVQERTAKLQETITELEAFSYSISHDMRAPLRAMQGYAETLATDCSDRLEPLARDYLARISRAATRLDSLVRDVLAYSKVTKGEIELHPVDLERLIEDILPSHPEFQTPRAHVEVVKPLHQVLGHEAYLTQCVTNLLGNAVKFVTPETLPQVRVWTESLIPPALEGGKDGPIPPHGSGNKVRLWFEDNGIGIDLSHQERIFQIFGQVHPEKKYGGTGIGLAIVRKAAHRMDGEVGVISELGKGSRFWIILNEAKHDHD